MSDNDPEVRRLTKRELGRHAFEERMPDRIAQIIKSESPKNKTPGIIPKLAGLLQQDRQVEVAYLCRQDVIQISKLSGEGNFCAYRNIQMLLPEPHRGHSILELQTLIEKGWDEGFSPDARIETGGIVGTRKYIGTAEAKVLCETLKIPCKATVFGPAETAWRELLNSVEAYFTTELPQSSPSVHVHITTHSPIFLQRPKHSLTIIGIERDRKGRRRLLVFDPAYQPSPAMKKPSSSLTKSSLARRLILYQYRRDERYLKRYKHFETLSLVEPG